MLGDRGRLVPAGQCAMFGRGSVRRQASRTARRVFARCGASVSPSLLGEIERLVLEVGEELVLPLVRALQRRDAHAAILAAKLIAETDAGIAALHAARGRAT